MIGQGAKRQQRVRGVYESEYQDSRGTDETGILGVPLRPRRHIRKGEDSAGNRRALALF